MLAALVLVALSTAAGVVFPLSPAGIALQTAVGTLGAPLVPAWAAGAAWCLARGQRPSYLRIAALAVLSLTWLVALALREPQAGGVVGETLLQLLDMGFGRSAGLALVSILGAAALVNLIGLDRILVWSQHGFGLTMSAWRARQKALPARPALRVPRPASGARGNEPVIMGPGGLGSGASTAAGSRSAEHRAAEGGVTDGGSRRAERPPPGPPRDATTWRRPDPAILGRATDGGSFSPAELKARAKIIEETLESFNIQARVVEVQQGPAITQFGVDPRPAWRSTRSCSARTTWRCASARQPCASWRPCRGARWSASRCPIRRWPPSNWAT